MVLFANNCQKEYEKQIFFLNAPRRHKLEGVKIKLSVMIVLFLYFSKKVILKWVGVPRFGRDRWKNRAKCRKMVIFSRLRQGIFQFVPGS